MSFTEHTGLVGPYGPRWENVWDNMTDPNGNLWVSTGSSIGHASLLKWSNREGYQIGLVNGKPEFDGELLGTGGKTDFRVTAMGISWDGRMIFAGPQGIYHLQGNQLVRFIKIENWKQNIRYDEKHQYAWSWQPSKLLVIDDGFLVSGHWGGIFQLSTKNGKDYKIHRLDGPEGRD